MQSAILPVQITGRLHVLMETLWKKVPGKTYDSKRDLGCLFAPANIRRQIMRLEWTDVMAIASAHDLPCTLVNSAGNRSFSFLMLRPRKRHSTKRPRPDILLALERTHFLLDPPPAGETGDWIEGVHEFLLSSRNMQLLRENNIPQVPVVLAKS